MITKNLKLSNQLEKLLGEKFPDKESKSTDKKLDTTLFDKISKKGLLDKVEYTLPLNDTLGQRFFNASKFRIE